MYDRFIAVFKSFIQLAQFHPQWRSAMPHDRTQEQLMFGFWLLWLLQLSWAQPAISTLGFALNFWRWLVVVFMAFIGGVILLYLMTLLVGRIRHFPVLFDGHVMGLFLSGFGFTLAAFLGAIATPDGGAGIWLSQAFLAIAGLWTLAVMAFVVRTSLRLKAPLATVIAGCYLLGLSVFEWLAQIALYNLETQYWPF